MIGYQSAIPILIILIDQLAFGEAAEWTGAVVGDVTAELLPQRSAVAHLGYLIPVFPGGHLVAF